MQRKTWFIFFFRSGLRMQGCDLPQVNIHRAHLPQTFTIWASQSLKIPALVGRNCTSSLKVKGMAKRNGINIFVWRVRECKSTSPTLQLCFPEVSRLFSRRLRSRVVSLWLIPSIYNLPDFNTMALRWFHIPQANWRVHEGCQRMLAQFILFIATLFKAQLLKQAFLC
jgi:hypothetical protein